MGKMKVYYYTKVISDKPEEDVFDEFPEKISYEGKNGPIVLFKDTIESVSDSVEYGEG